MAAGTPRKRGWAVDFVSFFGTGKDRIMTNGAKLEPLFSNADLEKLARGVKGLTREQQFNVYERLVAVRGHYEKDRQAVEPIDTTHQLPPVIDPRNYGETSMGHYIQSLDD